MGGKCEESGEKRKRSIKEKESIDKEKRNGEGGSQAVLQRSNCQNWAEMLCRGGRLCYIKYSLLIIVIIV